MYIGILKKVLLMILCMLFLNLACIANDTIIKEYNSDSLLKQAEILYTNNKYAEVIEVYKKLISIGLRNDDIYYNLANAYMKTGRIAEAIVNYENALVFAPRDPDILANLEYAKSLSSANNLNDNKNDQFLKIIFFWYYYLNLVELALLFLCINVLACILILADYIYENELLTSLKYFFIVISAILLISVAVKIFENYNISQGIVVDDSINVKSGNAENFITLYTLRQGEPVNIISSDGNWLKITDDQARKGWINKKSIGLIDAHF